MRTFNQPEQHPVIRNNSIQLIYLDSQLPGKLLATVKAQRHFFHSIQAKNQTVDTKIFTAESDRFTISVISPLLRLLKLFDFGSR